MNTTNEHIVVSRRDDLQLLYIRSVHLYISHTLWKVLFKILLRTTSRIEISYLWHFKEQYYSHVQLCMLTERSMPWSMHLLLVFSHIHRNIPHLSAVPCTCMVVQYISQLHLKIGHLSNVIPECSNTFSMLIQCCFTFISPKMITTVKLTKETNTQFFQHCLPTKSLLYAFQECA
jgi:hypothetical protein